MKPSYQFPEPVRVAAVQRYLSSDVSYRELSREVGVSTWTLRGWVKQHQSGDMAKRKPTRRSTEERSAQERFALLLKAKSLPDEQLGEFLRREGIREGDLERWEKDALSGLERRPAAQPQSLDARTWERRARKAEKRVREADALLDLQKKVQALWGAEEDGTPHS